MDYETYRKEWERAGQGHRPSRPIHLDLELVKGCNGGCSYCPSTNGFCYMNFQDALHWSEDAKASGVLSLKVNWRGEPTLYPHLIPFVERVKEMGFIDLMINTNGGFPFDLLSTLCLFTTVVFSIDTLDVELHQRLRPGINLDVVKRNIETLSCMSRRPRILRVNITETSLHTEQHIKEVSLWAQSLGVEVNIRPQAPRTGGKITLPRKRCPSPFQRLTVAWDGKVSPCCIPWDDSLVVGDLREQSLLEVWNGEYMRGIQQDALDVDYNHSVCQNCTSYASYQV